MVAMHAEREGVSLIQYVVALQVRSSGLASEHPKLRT
jgi:hypothetical protein